jgi:hypothetical protein
MCEPMGRRQIFLTFSQLVEIEGHFTNEFVSYVYETKDRFYCRKGQKCLPHPVVVGQIKKTKISFALLQQNNEASVSSPGSATLILN